MDTAIKVVGWSDFTNHRGNWRMLNYTIPVINRNRVMSSLVDGDDILATEIHILISATDDAARLIEAANGRL